MLFPNVVLNEKNSNWSVKDEIWKYTRRFTENSTAPLKLQKDLKDITCFSLCVNNRIWQ